MNRREQVNNTKQHYVEYVLHLERNPTCAFSPTTASPQEPEDDNSPTMLLEHPDTEGGGIIVAYTLLHLARDVQIPPCGAYLQKQHQMTAILLTNCQFHLVLVHKAFPHAYLTKRLGCCRLSGYPDTFFLFSQNIFLHFLKLQALQTKEEGSVKSWMTQMHMTMEKF